jgi:hypothetical protein
MRAIRLKAEKQDMKKTTEPLDPSPWAVLRLLSAAAGQGVFLFS